MTNFQTLSKPQATTRHNKYGLIAHFYVLHFLYVAISLYIVYGGRCWPTDRKVASLNPKSTKLPCEFKFQIHQAASTLDCLVV